MERPTTPYWLYNAVSFTCADRQHTNSPHAYWHRPYLQPDESLRLLFATAAYAPSLSSATLPPTSGA